LGRILVVDDNPEMRILLAVFLKKKGFDVKDVVNGEQALMEIKVGKPKIVLLDERMPGMDGLMVLKKIKELDESINVVMLTAIENEDIIKEATALGACDYLTKPCNLQEVEALVLSILMQEKYKK
jgi:two-component system response regulator (stage 0 sporulation protein F)